MKKRKTWKAKLTKKERKHLLEMGVRDKKNLESTLEHQANLRKKDRQASDPCWTCRGIAVKLGYAL